MTALTVTILPEPKLTVDADTSTGTVTFSQTEIPNLFYVNSEAVFQVTNGYEGYEIEDIRTIEKDKDVQNFHVKSYDAKAKTITLTANKLDSSTVTAFAAKNSPNAVANVEVKFKGYDGYYPKDGKYTFNVTNPNWTKTLTLTGKISKVDVKKLTMKDRKSVV